MGGQKNGQTGRSSNLMQEMFGVCEAKNGTKIDELLQVGASRYPRAWQNVEENSGP